MKKTYLIQSNQSNSLAFESSVKSLGAWFKYFYNNWLVESELSAKDIYRILTTEHKDISILIIEINTVNYFGRMDSKLWEYINDRKKSAKKQ